MDYPENLQMQVFGICNLQMHTLVNIGACSRKNTVVNRTLRRRPMQIVNLSQ